MTFRAKLTIALLSVALIPALIVGLLSFDSYKKTIETAHLSGLANITSYKADKIETYFSGLRTGIWIAQGTFAVKNNLPVLTRFSSNTDNAEFISAKQQIDETVRRMQKAFDLLDIMLVDPEGKIVYSSDPAGGQKNFLKALSDPQQKAFEEGTRAVYFTDIFPDDPENKKLVMLITAPAFDPKDVFAGVIVFKADMVPIYKLIGDIRGLGKTGEVLIGKKEGDQVVYLNPLKYDPQAALNKRISFGDRVGLPIQEAVRGKSGTGIVTDYRGTKVIASWRYIPSLGWGIVAKIDADEAFSDIVRLQKIVIVILALVFVLAGVMSFSIARSISRPIKMLSKGAEMIGEGNFDHKIAIDSKDEIGHLSRVLDKMTHDLKLKSGLERLVEKKTQEALVLREETEKAKRLADIGMLAATVAHELRNPLAGIRLAVYNIKRKVPDPIIEKNLQNIDNKVTESDQIINNLLFYSKIKVSHLKNINIYNILKASVEEAVKKDAEEASLISMDMESMKDLTIEADPLQIKEVFVNIINNAIDAVDAEKGRIEIAGKADNKFMTISIKDNGTGIREEDLGRVFEPFFTTKAKGTGLGLPVCKQIIMLHGGFINISSNPGEGTTVVISLPVEHRKT